MFGLNNKFLGWQINKLAKQFVESEIQIRSAAIIGQKQKSPSFSLIFILEKSDTLKFANVEIAAKTLLCNIFFRRRWTWNRLSANSCSNWTCSNIATRENTANWWRNCYRIYSNATDSFTARNRSREFFRAAKLTSSKSAPSDNSLYVRRFRYTIPFDQSIFNLAYITRIAALIKKLWKPMRLHFGLTIQFFYL